MARYSRIVGQNHFFGPGFNPFFQNGFVQVRRHTLWVHGFDEVVEPEHGEGQPILFCIDFVHEGFGWGVEDIVGAFIEPVFLVVWGQFL